MPGLSLRSIDRRTTLAFALASVILLGVMFAGERRVATLETASIMVDHTHQVIEQLGSAELLLSNAESAQRGYVLTGLPRYATLHHAQSALVLPALERLRAMIADNPSQLRRLDTLHAIAGLKLAQLRSVSRSREVDGLPAALALVSVNSQRPLMSTFSALVDRMQDTERQLLEQRSLERAVARGRLTGMMHAGELAALLIVLFAIGRARRDYGLREAAEHERDASANEVAAQAEELSAQNEELIAQGEALQVAMDLTEEANAAKSVFLAQMSHELRTPLNSVIGFANIVRRNPRGALLVSEVMYLDRVVENGRHLLRTINSILDLSKIEAKQESVELELVDLRELGREVLATLETQATAGQLHLELDAPAALAAVVTDRDKLRRVLINLVANAVKFTRPGGAVSIRVESVALMPTIPAAIEVRDTGVGIAPTRLVAIFEAFEQGDVGVGREFGGTGLGLSISRALCRLLGYELTVSSELGAGSVFRIALGDGQGPS